MNIRYPNWKDRSKDPDGFSETLECQMLVDEMKSLLHQLQTAIKFLRGWEVEHGVPEDEQFSGPKHNRVGIDNALIEHGALMALLIEKGIIKAKDYYEAQVEFLQRDVERYRSRLKEKYGMSEEQNLELH